jgi:hypothetical protein
MKKNSNGQLTDGSRSAQEFRHMPKKIQKEIILATPKKYPVFYRIRNNIGENIKYASYKEPITSLLQKEPCSLAAGQGVGSRDRTI